MRRSVDIFARAMDCLSAPQRNAWEVLAVSPVIVAAWGNAFSVDWMVFTSSVVTVIGLTPPGMVVILEARRVTISQS